MPKPMIDVGEIISRMELTARLNRAELKNRRRTFLRLRVSMWLMNLAAVIGGWSFKEDEWE